MKEKKIIDAEETIKKYLEKTNATNVEEVVYYKVDDLGDIIKKTGYAVKNFFSANRNSIIFLDKMATDLSNTKVTISKRPGEVYRNAVWFPIDKGTEKELLLKAIDLFYKSKSTQLIKLQSQVSDLRKAMHRLDRLKEYYEGKMEEKE